MSRDPAELGQRRATDPRDPPAAAEALARRLLAHEAKGRDGAQDLVSAGERALPKLRENLARLLGVDGFSALEERAVDLTNRRYPFLLPAGNGGGMHSLEEATAALATREPGEARDALLAVCAHLIGLLFTFLGEPLTNQLIHLEWPELPADSPATGEKERR